MKPIVAPSILAADPGCFADQVARVQAAGADWIHVDVMDGHFVPPITFGPGIVRAVKKAVSIPIDVHLMITSPENQLEPFAEAGADIITVHFETCPHLHRTVQRIRELGKKAGVSLNPATPVSALQSIIDYIDLVLIMTVNPGWGGQQFIAGSERRIVETRSLINKSAGSVFLEVDGGITEKTGALCCESGADVLVAGTFIFGKPDFAPPIRELHNLTAKK